MKKIELTVEATSDWAFITRQWLASGLSDESLFDEILTILGKSNGPLKGQILTFLEEVRDNEQSSPTSLPEKFLELPQTEFLTLNLCSLFRLMMISNLLPLTDPTSQSQLGQKIALASEKALEIAHLFEEPWLRASISCLASVGYRYSGDHEKALALAREATVDFHHLHRLNPILWKQQYLCSLNSLLMSLLELGKLVSARSVAIKMLSVDRNSEIFEPDRALIHHQLATCEFALDRFREAALSALYACKLYSALTTKSPKIHRHSYALALTNLVKGLRRIRKPHFGILISRRLLRQIRHLKEETEHSFPEIRAHTFDELGCCLFETGRKKIAMRIFRKAVDGYQAMTDQNNDAFLNDQAKAESNLAHCLSEIGHQDEAIKTFESSLRQYRLLNKKSNKTSREGFAITLNNYASLLSDLDKREHSLFLLLEGLKILENLPKHCSHHLLQVTAITFNNLAGRLARMERLQEALRTSRSAVRMHRLLEVTDAKNRNLSSYAGTLITTSTILRSLKHDQRAIVYLKRALAVTSTLRKPETDPVHNRALLNYALALEKVGRRLEAIQTAEQVVKHYRTDQSLEVRPLYAVALNNLAKLKIPVSPNESFQHLQEALKTFRNLPENVSDVFLEEGTKIFWHNSIFFSDSSELSDQRKALELLQAAWDLSKRFRGRFDNPSQKRRVHLQRKILFEDLIERLYQLSQRLNDSALTLEAVKVVDSAKAASLIELLAEKLPSTNPRIQILQSELTSVRKQLSTLEDNFYHSSNQPLEFPQTFHSSGFISRTNTTLRLGPSNPQLKKHHRNQSLHEMAEVRDSISALETKIQSAPGSQLSRLDVKMNDILETIPKAGALIHICTFSSKSYVFTTFKNGLCNAIELPHFDRKRAKNYTERWHEFFSQRNKSMALNGPPSDMARGILKELAERVMTPIHQMLSRYKKGTELSVLLCPHEFLHLLPLHACPLPEGATFGETHHVTYLSSATSHFLSQKASTAPEAAPCGSNICLAHDNGNLIFSKFELDEIRNVLSGPESDPAANLCEESYSQCDIFHYAGHAHYNPRSPKDSYIGGDNWTITVEKLCQTPRFQDCRLAFLNGCESGLIAPNEMDDYMSFPTALLYSGAKTVISTLWPVEDLPAALLSIRFYQILRESVEIRPSEALREAQAWLRGEHPDGPITGVDLVESVLPRLLATTSSRKLQQACDEKSLYLKKLPSTLPPFSSPLHWAPYIIAGSNAPIRLQPNLQS